MDFIYYPIATSVSSGVNSKYSYAKNVEDPEKIREIFLKENRKFEVKYGLIGNEKCPIEIIENYSNLESDPEHRRSAKSRLDIRKRTADRYLRHISRSERIQGMSSLPRFSEPEFSDTDIQDYLYLSGERGSFFSQKDIDESERLQDERDFWRMKVVISLILAGGFLLSVLPLS